MNEIQKIKFIPFCSVNVSTRKEIKDEIATILFSYLWHQEIAPDICFLLHETACESSVQQ
jgi:hypothetical protein